MAVRAEDPEHVVRALRLRGVLPANWAAGLSGVESEGVFVTPSVAGWVLAVGRDLAVATQQPSAVEGLLSGLSEQFESAFWFSTDEVRDAHGWACAERGKLLRAYAYSEDHGHTLWHGDVMDAERDLGCFLDDPRDHSEDEIKWWPDRRVVFALAAAWSIDPSQWHCQTGSEGVLGQGVGWVGRV